MVTSVDNIVIAENLTKTYITKTPVGFLRKKTRVIRALRGVSLTVNEGEIFGLLGPNGAGKTTLIKILTTLLIPDSGRAWVLGYDVVRQPNEVRRRVGVMLMGERALYWKLTGRENLEFFGSLYKVPRGVLSDRIRWIIDFLGLQEFADRLVETYSSGQRVLLAFAKALINDALLLFLDEPTVALDPRRALDIRMKILELRNEGKTIFLTTHMMHEAEELCDRVAIIDEGKIVAIGRPDELKDALRGRSAIEVDLSGGNIDAIVDSVGAVEGVERVAWSVVSSERGQVVRIRAICDSPRMVLPEVIERILTCGGKILYVKPEEPTLEDVFLHYTGKLIG